ncbi:hypothetical protein, partial [Alistipes sp.]|uniref:hypothetical protein n=1 Tax=Alistipes sp. TaxID=1872444 RepID=UPI003AB0E7C3
IFPFRMNRITVYVTRITARCAAGRSQHSLTAIPRMQANGPYTDYGFVTPIPVVASASAPHGGK